MRILTQLRAAVDQEAAPLVAVAERLAAFYKMARRSRIVGIHQGRVIQLQQAMNLDF
jgi:hypothetical protein